MPEKKNLPDPVARMIAWVWRIAIASAILSTIGYFSNPGVSPLMCKVYG